MLTDMEGTGGIGFTATETVLLVLQVPAESIPVTVYVVLVTGELMIDVPAPMLPDWEVDQE